MEMLRSKIFTSIDRGTSLFFFILLLFLLPLIWFVPLYTDEVAWKWLSARFLLDAGKTISLYPQCSLEFTNHLPVFFYPVFWLNSFLYGELGSLIFLRFGSLFSVLIIFLLLRQIFKELGKPFFTAPFVLGVLPFSFLLNRPEQMMLIGMLTVILISFQGAGKVWHSLKWLVLLLFGSSVFFGSHAKALFFLPVFLGCIAVSKPSKLFKALGTLGVSVLGASCFQYFSAVTKCSNPVISEIFTGMMISPEALFADPGGALNQITKNLWGSGKYFSSHFFTDRYILEWLPENYGFSVGARALNFAFGFFWLAMGFALIVKLFKSQGKGLWIARWIGLGFCGLAAFQSSKSFYDSPFLMVLLWVSVGISFTSEELNFIKVPTRVLASLSLILLCYRFYPVLKQSWYTPGPLPNQNHSIKIAYSSEIKERVSRLRQKCKIAEAKSLKHFIVDDLTYPYFWQSQEPYHAIYVTGWWGEESISDLEGFFSERKVPGYLAQCHWLPPRLRSRAIRDRDLCCLAEF